MTRVCLVLAALLFGALGVVVSPQPAYACSCAGISTGRALRNADAVFRGRVTAKEPVGRRDEQRIDLRDRGADRAEDEGHAPREIRQHQDGCGASQHERTAVERREIGDANDESGQHERQHDREIERPARREPAA